MQDDKRSSRFLTLEGGEGTGKSTQAAILARRLSTLGHEVVTTREPGGSPIAEHLRTLILSGYAKPFGPFAEAALFSAARADHLRTVIRPALARGAWVICDRFADSMRAYQGALGNLDPSLIRGLERIVVRDTRPDLTLLLDIDPEEGLARAAARGAKADRFEAETVEFHRALRAAFLDIAEAEPDRVTTIDASGTQDQVAERIWAVVCARFTLQCAEA